jgi:protein-S-isoprenylcysteine O-methyltransferase Ste14
MTWVAAQTALMAAIVASAFFPPHPHGLAPYVAGGALLAVGIAIFVWARVAMGAAFTVLPEPRAGGELVTSGPFRLVRNPIYLGALLCLAGGSLYRSWIGLGLTAAIGVLWAGKVRVEERYLAERFPEYADYCRRVRFRLLPFVY